MSRLLVTGARVLTPDATDAPFAEILVEHGKVAALLPPGTTVADATLFDARERLVMPGFGNAHTHGHGGLSKGMGDKWDLALLLAHAPWIGGGRGVEEKRLATTLTAVEMLKKGCTGFYDLAFEFPGPSEEGMHAMAEAYRAVGLRGVLAPMVADLTFFQATPGLVEALPEAHRARAAGMRMAETAATLAEIERIAAAWPHAADGIALGVAPTIPLHGTEDFLKGCRRIAERHGLRMQTHVGEARFQAGGGEVRYGSTLLAHMDKMGLVGPWFSVAHGIWLTDEDLALLAAKGGALAHNPGSNMRLGNGIAPIRKAIDAGVTVGVGTDGSGSSDNQNMFEATRLAAFASRLYDTDVTGWIGAPEAIRLATSGSARLIGLDATGTIAPGQAADLVFLDLAHTNWAPFNSAPDQIVNAEDGLAVRDVMIGGVLRLKDGKVVGLDEAKLWRDANDAAARLHEASAPLRAWCEEVAPHVACHCADLARRFQRVQRLLPVH